MTPQHSEQPRTAAGQKLLRYLSGLEGGIEPPQWVKDMMASDILAIEAEAAAPDPVASPLEATTVREGGDWTREEGMGPVPMGEAYALDHEASALPAVASPAPMDVERLITDEEAERWLRDHDLYAVTHLHPAPADCGECNAAETMGQPVAEEPA